MTTLGDPVTPLGRLFLQPEIGHVVTCILGGENPIDVNAVKSVIQNSVMFKHPRFTSLMVKDGCGREHWRKTTVDLDCHVIVVPNAVGPSRAHGEEAVNDYVADLAVSKPLSTEKPLWEVHLLMAHNCAVLRLHHALGDGISLMSMLACCGCGAGDSNRSGKAQCLPSLKRSVWGFMKTTWFTSIYLMEILRRILWVKDKTTPLSSGAGIEMWPRKLATAKFNFEDMVTVKNAIGKATINDVLCGVISSGLSRYISIHYPNIEDGLRITGVEMANLRPQPGLPDVSELIENNCATMKWNNNLGIILLPIYYIKSVCDPLNYVKMAKETNDRKKQSLEPNLSYKIIKFITDNFSAKLSSYVTYRIMCNTSLTLSNIVGPKEDIVIADNPIKFIRVTSTSLPHAITMHMVSYAGRADLQILVAKDIIPDPQLLATFMEDALLEMKKSATAS